MCRSQRKHNNSNERFGVTSLRWYQKAGNENFQPKKKKKRVTVRPTTYLSAGNIVRKAKQSEYSTTRC